MFKKIAILLLIPNIFLFSEENKTDQGDFQEKPHSTAEIALDITKGVIFSAGAGFSAAHGNIAGAGGIIGGAESFKQAGDKAFENMDYEKNRDSESMDRENDRDSWDRDY